MCSKTVLPVPLCCLGVSEPLCTPQHRRGGCFGAGAAGGLLLRTAAAGRAVRTCQCGGRDQGMGCGEAWGTEPWAPGILRSGARPAGCSLLLPFFPSSLCPVFSHSPLENTVGARGLSFCGPVSHTAPQEDRQDQHYSRKARSPPLTLPCLVSPKPFIPPNFIGPQLRALEAGARGCPRGMEVIRPGCRVPPTQAKGTRAGP